MTFLLDTNAVSELMNDNPQVVARMTAASSVHAIVTSTIVRGEILYGVARLQAGWRKSLFEAKAAAVFNLLPCMPVTAAVADHYARLKADQEKRGIVWMKTTCGSPPPHGALTQLSLAVTVISSGSLG